MRVAEQSRTNASRLRLISDTTATVLFICTGNICRSVMAEAMLRKRIEAEGIDLSITTAGLARADVPPPHRAMAAMRKRGLDISAHRSAELAPDMIDDASLVLGAAPIHAWEAVALRPSAVGRIFTFKEFVRLGRVLGQPPPGQPLDDWIREVHLSRRRFRLGRPDDEIEDPYRRGRRVYARVASEIEALVEELAGLIFPILGEREPPARGAPDSAIASPPDPGGKGH